MDAAHFLFRVTSLARSITEDLALHRTVLRSTDDEYRDRMAKLVQSRLKEHRTSLFHAVQAFVKPVASEILGDEDIHSEGE